MQTANGWGCHLTYTLDGAQTHKQVARELRKHIAESLISSGI